MHRLLIAGEHKCTLELTIPATGERNIYTLIGKAQDPVAESHIVIECQARRVAHKTISVSATRMSPCHGSSAEGVT